MLWAGRAWWTFKLYGHDKVSVLNGGLDAWKSAGQPVTNDIVVVQPSDWTAKPFDLSRIITFEELNKKQSDGKSLFEKLDRINYVDARPAGQFNGTEPMGVAAEGATGAHVKGAKNIPLAAVVTEKGLKPKEEIKRDVTGATLTVYDPLQGSMTEVGLRAPELISVKNT
ncbi:Rhodanese domain-containing protein [Trichostrongylus colubriformis]|uniref:Rhodanese domain-containing protein n=1 Tax=Trichostrongylus colubriformis TaxID=6319 RepID=A0AAN8FCC7_TRICO